MTEKKIVGKFNRYDPVTEKLIASTPMEIKSTDLLHCVPEGEQHLSSLKSHELVERYKRKKSAKFIETKEELVKTLSSLSISTLGVAFSYANKEKHLHPQHIGHMYLANRMKDLCDVTILLLIPPPFGFDVNDVDKIYENAQLFPKSTAFDYIYFKKSNLDLAPIKNPNFSVDDVRNWFLIERNVDLADDSAHVWLSKFWGNNTGYIEMYGDVLDAAPPNTKLFRFDGAKDILRNMYIASTKNMNPELLKIARRFEMIYVPVFYYPGSYIMPRKSDNNEDVFSETGISNPNAIFEKDSNPLAIVEDLIEKNPDVTLVELNGAVIQAQNKENFNYSFMNIIDGDKNVTDDTIKKGHLAIIVTFQQEDKREKERQFLFHVFNFKADSDKLIRRLSLENKTEFIHVKGDVHKFIMDKFEENENLDYVKSKILNERR